MPFSCLGTVSEATSLVTNEKSDLDKSTLALTLPPLRFPSDSAVTVDAITGALTNFREAKLYYRQKVLEGNHELPHIYNGNPSVQDVFRQIFPELVKSRGITMLQRKDMDGDLFARWKEGHNEVTLELTDGTECTREDEAKNIHLDAVFIGGPATLTACLQYQLRYPKHRVQHLFADRHDSNCDGSAYYYHQRDAAPVYINRVNRGPYCIYIDLYKRLINPKKLVDQAETDRHHVKISLNWTNLKIRYLFTIFLPNVWHMINDLWLKNKKKTKIAHVIEHACRAMPIVHEITNRTGVQIESMVIHGKNKANYVGFASSNKDPKEHFTWLNQFAHIPFHEISRDGFGEEVSQVLNFPTDGLIAPMILGNLQKQISTQAQLSETKQPYETSRSSAQLKKIFVQPVVSNDRVCMRVTSIAWLDLLNGVTQRTSVDRAFVSLGPSGQIKMISPKLTLAQHALDVMRKRSDYASISVYGGYKPTISSLWRHTLNMVLERFFRGAQCLKDFMLASGSSSVMILGVELDRAKPAQLDVFSRFVDGVNQHWTLIAQRDVILPATTDPASTMKSYRFFAIQMTGGGNFPSRLVRPDFLLNLLYTTEKMYGIDVIDHAIYDLVQSRGCGRSVSAQNTIAFQPLASNATVSYALGGIGMTTMFSNGAKMIELIEEEDAFLKEVPKDKGWSARFLDGIDYSFMVGNPRQTERFFGFDESMTRKEKILVVGSTAALMFGLMVGGWIYME